MASGGGAEHAYDMAQNAKNEPGLIDWVKKNRIDFGDVTPLERIQYDIEAMAESVNETKSQLSMVSKSRAKASLRQIKKGKRDDGMGKFDAKLYGIDASGDEHEITDEDEIGIYKKFGLRSESVNESVSDFPMEFTLEKDINYDSWGVHEDKLYKGTFVKDKILSDHKKGVYINHEGKQEVTLDLNDIRNLQRLGVTLNEMKMVHKGKDITKHVLDYMEKKITKPEFEKLTGLKKDKLKVNESVIGDILIIADENNTFAAFTAELVNQKYLMPDELEDPETREWLETTYAQVHESISMKSLLPINEGSISDTFDLILNTINKNKKIKPAKPYFKAAKRIASKSPGLRSLKDIRDHLEQTLTGFKVSPIRRGGAYPSLEMFRLIDPNRKIYSVAMDLDEPGEFDIAFSPNNDFNESVNEARDFKKGDKVSYKNDDGKTKFGYIIKKMTKTFRGKKSIQYLIGKTKNTDPRLGRFDTVSTAAGKTPKNMFFREDHMSGAPYEYDNISEPYSIKVGDMVKNTNPSCPHNGSQGMVKKVIPMPNDIGQLIKYVVMNQGDTYQAGDVLTKTPDQLEVM